jgi:hypothetical protein
MILHIVFAVPVGAVLAHALGGDLKWFEAFSAGVVSFMISSAWVALVIDR